VKAKLIETWGVHIGWARWTGFGWLIFAATKGFVCFANHWESPREILENYWTDKMEGGRCPAEPI
jgi:hypothetical protein